MDGWDSILTSVISNLPNLGGLGGLGLVLILTLRWAAGADRRHRDEVAEHEKTQKALDEERAVRRKAEDDLGRMGGEMREVKEQVAKLERQVADLRMTVGP